MRESRIRNQVSRVPIGKLVAHPDNPNRMSGKVFDKLIRNIERTGRYEPIVVRSCPTTNCHSCESRNPETNGKAGCDCFQIINGHHRVKALKQLGFENVDVVIWDVDDKEADILLATLNRLGGSDVLEKKLALLKRLNKQIESRKLSKLLPQTVTQINRLVNLRRPTMPAKLYRKSFAKPLVFFLNNKQCKVVENALSRAVSMLDAGCPMLDERTDVDNRDSTIFTKAEKRAIAFAYICQKFTLLYDREKNENQVSIIENREQ